MENDILDNLFEEEHSKKAEAKNFFLWQILICFFFEALFVFEVFRVGNKDMIGSSLKGLAIITSLFIVHFGFLKMKWIILPAFLLLSIACFLGAAEQESVIMLLCGLYYLYFIFTLFFSKKIQYLKRS